MGNMKTTDDDDDDAASMSLLDINIPKKDDGDWEKISSVTITEITNPYYRSLLAIQNKEHSYSMCSSVSEDDDTSIKSLGESRNLESLAGEESYLNVTRRKSASQKKSEQTSDQRIASFNFMPSWKQNMLEALQGWDLSRKSDAGDDELLILELNQAIDAGLHIIDKKENELLHGRSVRESSLLTIDEGPSEGIDESSQNEAARRMSRGLSILESDRNTLLALKRDMIFDGNHAEYFSWNNFSQKTETEGDESDSQNLSMLLEARESLRRGVAEEEDIRTSSRSFLSDESCKALENNTGEHIVDRTAALLGSYNKLLSFCFTNSSHDEELTIFTHT